MALKVATAVEDITPENGEDLCGFALRKGPTSGIADRLKGRWVSLIGTGNREVCLGSADILSLTRSRFETICREAQSRYGKPTDLVLSTTHTHAGPATAPLRRCGVMNRDYMDSLEDKLAGGATRALKARHRKVNVYLGKSLIKWGIIRRGRHAGEDSDPQLLTLNFRDEATGKSVATIVNYACHPVVLGHENSLVSGDYPGYLCSTVEAEIESPCLFLNGACGDINPINAHSKDIKEAVKAGQAIGRAALKAIHDEKPINSDTLMVFRQTVEIPVHRPRTKSELQLRLKMLKTHFGLDSSIFASRLERDLKQMANNTFPRQVTIELSLVCLGNQFAILYVPGELFSSIGAHMRAVAAAEGFNLMISCFSNGTVGYLCDRNAYEDGGYEPYYAHLFYDFPEFVPGVEDNLLEGFSRLVKKRTSALRKIDSSQ